MACSVNTKGARDARVFQSIINQICVIILCKCIPLSLSAGCPDSYARIVNVSSDVHRYGTINLDNLNDRYELRHFI